MIRVIIAGILGGIVIFFCGFVEHGVLSLQTRAMQALPDEEAVTDLIRAQKLEYGVYNFPEMPKGATPEEVQKSTDEMTKKYKDGPNGLLFIGRTGEDPMTPRELGMEAGSNVAAALLCSFILALMSPRNGFATRLCVCFLIGLIAWLSIDASYGIWYRFPNLWVMDGLICSLAEWLIAGVLMSAIVKPFYPELTAVPAK
jgi:hypothetical protein